MNMWFLYTIILKECIFGTQLIKHTEFSGGVGGANSYYILQEINKKVETVVKSPIVRDCKHIDVIIKGKHRDDN